MSKAQMIGIVLWKLWTLFLVVLGGITLLRWLW